MKSDGDPISTRNRNLGLGLVAIACGVLCWYFSRSPVELDGEGYDLTIALYRVCNQRDADGLHEIEGRLKTMHPPQSQSDPQQDALQDIVHEAQQGNWRAAMTACRALLDDQVRR